MTDYLNELKSAARALIAKLDECDKHITAAFDLAYTVKGVSYDGPHYGKERVDLQHVLDRRGKKQEVKGYEATRKIMIYTDYGGFHIGTTGLFRYNERRRAAGKAPVARYDEIQRDDPILVALFEENPQMMTGGLPGLEIVEIPADVDWCIEDYDGCEWVAEKHRTWPPRGEA